MSNIAIPPKKYIYSVSNTWLESILNLWMQYCSRSGIKMKMHSCTRGALHITRHDSFFCVIIWKITQRPLSTLPYLSQTICGRRSKWEGVWDWWLPQDGQTGVNAIFFSLLLIMWCHLASKVQSSTPSVASHPQRANKALLNAYFTVKRVHDGKNTRS